jgi:PAS domain S-box-containing protein
MAHTRASNAPAATDDAIPRTDGAREDPDGGHGDVHELLTAAVEEAARLLGTEGAMVYLLDPATGSLRFAHDAGIKSPRSRAWVRSIDLPIGVGMFGRAVAERSIVVTGNYLDDPSFDHADEPDRVVRDIGIQSMVVAPLVAGDDIFGALGAFSSRADAFTPAQIGLVRALADHAAAAMRNVRLIEALDNSRRELADRAAVERSLREIAARISAATDLQAVLQLGVDEAARLLRADGARIDLVDQPSGLLRWAYASGAVRPDDTIWPDDPNETLDQGVSGQAVVLGRPFWTGDYANDKRFPHGHGADTYVEASELRSVLAAPLTGETGPFGALTAFTSRPDAWGQDDARLLEAIADQAAIMIRTTRLIDELDRSREALGRRADAEQALREIAARITVLRDPTEILQDVVAQAGRLVKADGVILDLLDPATGDLHWAMDDGLGGQFTDEERAKLWISVGVGATGIAVAQDRVIVADDDLAAQFPPSPESTEFYERTGFHSMIAAPITGDAGALGVIEVYSKRKAAFTSDDADLVEALADQAAIAITNSTLLSRLTESEARYRYLVERAPDLVWSIGADARLTFLSDAVVRLTGRQPGELLGKHFGALVHESSREVADFDWTTGMRRGSQEVRGRVNLAGADGRPVPAEFIAAARLDEHGRFLGANGSVRDMREQDRLERELRESESRYRFLVENAPDVVFATDAEGRITFASDALERMAGWRPEEVVGEPYGKIVDAASAAPGQSRWEALAREPAVKQTAIQSLKRPDGSLVPVEISAIGIVDEHGDFDGIHGSARDISERIRLERELRRQAGELAAGEERAHLARELHDSVTQALFSMTLVSRSVEMLLDRDAAAARTHLSQLRELQREALAEMRALIFELRPGNLEQDGLTRALRTHSAALQGRIGLPVVVESSLTERLPLAIEEALYRIAQEALHNVVKHAGARQVRVELDRAGSGVRLRVEDDGKGFDPQRVPDGHLGLTGMRARADRIGAKFTCRSEPGQGTTIEVAVPETAIAGAGLPNEPAESSSIRDE